MNIYAFFFFADLRQVAHTNKKACPNKTDYKNINKISNSFYKKTVLFSRFQYFFL